jgi:hypothetical protein
MKMNRRDMRKTLLIVAGIIIGLLALFMTYSSEGRMNHAIQNIKDYDGK